MKTIFEVEEMELIAQRIAELIKPLIRSGSPPPDDPVFTVESLATYLQTNPNWIYKHVCKLPHFKIDGLLRFRKSEIDRFIAESKME